jgi:D-tagatose-1,6-bisphosphate aldolase subunit GatZ/KbaZ
VHGGLADLNTFSRFLELLRVGLHDKKLHDIWPCFVVGKVGTDLHTTYFDASVARQLTGIAEQYGSLIKGHYSDNVENPKEYPLSGMGAANFGPEFTEREYEGLMELVSIEKKLVDHGVSILPSNMKHALWEAVIFSGRWKKWLQDGESRSDFYSLTPTRQEWLIKTGCRYIWQNLSVVQARSILYENLYENGILAEEIVSSHIERAIERYFYAFNLVDFNKYL